MDSSHVGACHTGTPMYAAMYGVVSFGWVAAGATCLGWLVSTLAVDHGSVMSQPGRGLACPLAAGRSMGLTSRFVVAEWLPVVGSAEAAPWQVLG